MRRLRKRRNIRTNKTIKYYYGYQQYFGNEANSKVREKAYTQQSNEVKREEKNIKERKRLSKKCTSDESENSVDSEVKKTRSKANKEAWKKIDKEFIKTVCIKEMPRIVGNPYHGCIIVHQKRKYYCFPYFGLETQSSDPYYEFYRGNYQGYSVQEAIEKFQHIN